MHLLWLVRGTLTHWNDFHEFRRCWRKWNLKKTNYRNSVVWPGVGNHYAAGWRRVEGSCFTILNFVDIELQAIDPCDPVLYQSLCLLDESGHLVCEGIQLQLGNWSSCINYTFGASGRLTVSQHKASRHKCTWVIPMSTQLVKFAQKFGDRILFSSLTLHSCVWDITQIRLSSFILL